MTGFRNFILAASLMAGVIIGAGIFALPFIFSKVGFLAGIFYLTVFTAVFIAIHLMYAEIITKTKGDEHRFAGYAKIYFGKAGYYAAILMTVVGMFFVLTIYLALSVSFLPSVGLPAGAVGLILFWVASSLPIFFNVKEVAILEFV
ncbi:MAG: aromatic amino acid transport family protein, partial [Patescibacteria group bacterium]